MPPLFFLVEMDTLLLGELSATSFFPAAWCTWICSVVAPSEAPDTMARGHMAFVAFSRGLSNRRVQPAAPQSAERCTAAGFLGLLILQLLVPSSFGPSAPASKIRDT